MGRRSASTARFGCRRSSWLAVLVALALPAQAGAAEPRFVSTWGLAPATPAEATAERSMRMIARTTVGGDRIQVRLSNNLGSSEVTFTAATVALRGEGAAVRAPVLPLTFGGSPSVTVPRGGEILSDPAELEVPPNVDVAVSFHVRSAPVVTSHMDARKTSYLATPGADHTADVSGAAYTDTTTSMLFLSEVLVRSRAAGTIVGLGSSSVDGTGTRDDAEERWSDVMARRLLARPECGQYGYVNEGVDADTFDGMLARLPRDVLAREGVRYVILYGGSGNDIATGDSAEEAIRETEAIIAALRAEGIRVIGGTLIPREQGTIPGQEAERQKYNQWVRTAGAFDAVIDFETPVTDPAQPGRYKPGFSSDGIHAGPEGNRLQGESIDLGLFDPAGNCESARPTPRVRLRASLERSGPSYRVAARGRLELPSGTTCGGGRVVVRVWAGKRRIARRRAPLRGTCSFRTSALFANARSFRGRERLRVTARFPGNDALGPARAKPRRVRVR